MSPFAMKISISRVVLIVAVVFGPFSQRLSAQDTTTWVRFSSFTYSGKTAVTARDGEYLNPIIAGFYPDPSICRVGDDYYLVNSSFNYFPGIPIWRSKDLVNWTQLGHVIDRPSQFGMRGGAVQNGIYAPTIRYHNGTFYVVCTFVGGIGNFYVTTTDPAGPWSEPIRLQGVGGMDPSFFFDDGKCYITNCDEPPQGVAQYNGHRTIRLQEVDLEQKKVVGEQTILVNGGTDIAKRPIWCEGPHLYKIKGKYYLMCAQGGTEAGHTEVVFRSEFLRGPYVPWDRNPILTAADLPDNRPDRVTCTGHADLVQTAEGDWYAVFLGCEPYQSNFFNTGRQTFMLPVKWEDDWPVILPPKTPVPLSLKKPALAVDKPAAIPTTGNISFTDHFDSDRLAFRWIGLRAPVSQWWSAGSGRGLYIQPRADGFAGQGNPSYLSIRQRNNDFTCTVTLAAEPKTIDCTAGLAAFQNEMHYFALNVKSESGHLTEISVERGPGATSGRASRGGAATQAATRPALKLPDQLTSIELKIEGAGPVMRCFYRACMGQFVQVGEDLQSSFLSTETAGGFQGVTLGMFARE